MSRREITDLKWAPLFSGCNARQLRSIMARAKEEQFDSGARILEEGERGFDLYLILNGKVEVRRGDHVLAMLEAGNFFGEMAALEEAPRSAGVFARESTRCLRVSLQELREIISSNPDIAMKMLQELSHRLRMTDQMVLISAKEREECNRWLIKYLQDRLDAGDDELVGLRKKLALTYWVIVGLSIFMFLIGAALLSVPAFAAFGGGQIGEWTSVIAGGFGIADLAALFFFRPVERIHGLMGDMGQITLAINSFQNQVALRLLETSSEGRDTMGKAAEHVREAAKDSIGLIQTYFEEKSSR